MNGAMGPYGGIFTDPLHSWIGKKKPFVPWYGFPSTKCFESLFDLTRGQSQPPATRYVLGTPLSLAWVVEGEWNMVRTVLNGNSSGWYSGMSRKHRKKTRIGSMYLVCKLMCQVHVALWRIHFATCHLLPPQDSSKNRIIHLIRDDSPSIFHLLS